MTNDTNGLFDGFVVSEVGSVISGPAVGRLMAGSGATVIKIKHPAFDDHIRCSGPQKDGVSLWHRYLSRNKRSTTSNASTDEGMAVFRDLVGEADLLIENSRPDTLERWNVGWECFSEVSDDLVMPRLLGFGQTGPYSERPEFGMLAEAMSGFAYLNGFPGSPPLFLPTGLANNIMALFSTFVVMFTLHYRDVHGDSNQYIGTNLTEPIFGLLGSQSFRYDQLDAIELRSGNRSTLSTPRNVYRTDDDRWVAISASVQPLAERTFNAVDRPDLKGDLRFETNGDRLEHVNKLDIITQDWMDDHSHEEVLDAFEAADTTLASVYNIEDILNDEHYAAREAFLTVDSPDLGEAVVQNAFPKFSETPGRVDHPGPSPDEHNDAVYRDRLGCDEPIFSDLETKDVI